jgi:type II secretory pathway pseudopilin PulG
MKDRGEGGFTLVETILGLVVMTIMVLAVTQLFISNLKTVTLGKARAISLSLANEQMEYLRDLPYQNVATLGGAIYPPGTIPDSQTVSRGGYTFTLKTEVTYVDDPYDGYITCPCSTGPAAGKPKDLNPADYKKSQVSVYLKSNGQLVSQITSDFAGKAAETASNTGILSVKVIDASGAAVANANVHIKNTTPNPDVDITTTTDNQGLVVIPNLPPDSGNRYFVTASLPGYSSDYTEAEPNGTPTAVELNPNVLVQQITGITMAIDRTSTLAVHVVDTSGNPLSSKIIQITGAKALEKNGSSVSLYKYSQPSTTDGSGDITLANMEWDSYSFTPPSGYYLVSVSPLAPVALSPNGSLSTTVMLSTSSTYPRVSTFTPVIGQTGTSAIALKFTGTNLLGSSTVTLKKSGQSDIIATGVSSQSGNTILNATINLTGAATGNWDVVVSNANGTVTQTGGLNVKP